MGGSRIRVIVPFRMCNLTNSVKKRKVPQAQCGNHSGRRSPRCIASRSHVVEEDSFNYTAAAERKNAAYDLMLHDRFGGSGVFA
jgi:hypothetical protein